MFIMKQELRSNSYLNKVCRFDAGGSNIGVNAGENRTSAGFVKLVGMRHAVRLPVLSGVYVSRNAAISVSEGLIM